MDHLHTYALLAAENPNKQHEYTGDLQVFWKFGKKKGVFDIVIEDAKLILPADRLLAAELSICKYLLEVKEIAGDNRDGNLLHLTFSSPGVKALLARSHESSYLPLYANFLVTRFYDANIEIDSQPSWFSEIKNYNRFERLALKQPSTEKVYMHPLGHVMLTSKALDIYRFRNGEEPAPNSWRNLRNMVADQSIVKEVEEPFRNSKYADSTVVSLYHPQTRWAFIVVVHANQSMELVHMYWLGGKRPSNPDMDMSAPQAEEAIETADSRKSIMFKIIGSLLP